MRVLVAVIFAFVAFASAQDQCSPFPTCETCISHDLCGWCSVPVIYKNGQKGSHCAGFNKNNSEPFVCPDIYSTEHCIQGYHCDEATKTCKMSQPGEGTTKEKCMEKCHPIPSPASPKPNPSPAGTWICNQSVVPKCVPATPGHGASKMVCEEDCQPMFICNQTTHQCYQHSGGMKKATCDASCKVVPKPPAALVGLWRGLQINAGYASGEWDLNFQEAGTVTIVGPSFKLTGSVESSGSSKKFQITATSGTVPAGQKLSCIYKTDPQGPETYFAGIACGAPGAAYPASLSGAMGAGGYEWALAKCLPGFGCSFHMAAGDNLSLDIRMNAVQVNDPCMPLPTCKECLAHQFCGWCSTDVIYHGGVAGKRCAGFSGSSNGSQPFVCPGVYRTDSCNDYVCQQPEAKCMPVPLGDGLPKSKCEEDCKPPASTYVCNITTKKCEKAQPGHGASKDVCEEACKKHNGTNGANLTGVYRGIAIQNNYESGEYDMTVKQAEFTITKDKSPVMAGTLEFFGPTGAVQMKITAGENSGKTLYGTFEKTQGTEVTYMTMALSKAGATSAPTWPEAEGSGGFVFVWTTAKKAPQ
eukprot:NODE_938_length_1979_cov_136.492996_g890_i0.p1 GENE.NODE_938_length_1979_cov_136.492996_g890_i0~~NODE_938_length_1979_cov_136.492996_g890_i0.p1  ORF type:complete len:602 (-),score=187.19 NODE_938_length_1979_cov_136.492996_g890_i0:173-1924(-)